MCSTRHAAWKRTFRFIKSSQSMALVISGMLAGESANSIRVIDSEGKEKQVLREDIDQLVSLVEVVNARGLRKLDDESGN